MPADLIRGAARLYAKGGNGGDLLRARRHRAQPGLDHGDGHRQSRHGHRQYRPARRRREPAARAEQCAGLLRHGLVPARGVRLPPHLGGRHPRHVRDAVGPAARRRARLAHPQHDRRRARRLVQGHLHPGRGHSPVRPQHAAYVGRSRRHGMRRGAGPVPGRDRELRPCVPAGLDVPREERHLHQCRAPHPDGAQGHGAAERLRGLADHRAAFRRARLSDALQPPVGDHGRDRAV